MTITNHIRKGVVGNNTRIGPVLNVLVTAQFGPNRFEIKMGSVARDGSESWVVISRGVESHVTEPSFKCTEPIDVDTSTPGTEQPAAFLPWQAQRGTTSSSKKENDEHFPINQRKPGTLLQCGQSIGNMFLHLKENDSAPTSFPRSSSPRWSSSIGSSDG